MTNQYDDTNTIVLFKNNNKTENSPVLSGKVNVEGVDYEVALWGRKSNKDGSVFWSGKITKPESKQPAQDNVAVDSEEIPF